MAIISFLPRHISLCFLVLHFLFTQISAKSPPSTKLGTNFSCTSNSPISCLTYVADFAQSPSFMDLKNISDLFGVANSLIAEASNLISKSTPLNPGELLLVALTCTCNGSHYFANISYTIKKGDSYYLVSTHSFENLTNWRVVQNPYRLHIGTKVIFPLFCGCPSKSNLQNGITHFITYVRQPSDHDIFRVGAKFGAMGVDILTEKNYHNFTAAVRSPILIPVPRFPSDDHDHERRNKAKHRLTLSAVMISSVGAILFFVWQPL